MRLFHILIIFFLTTNKLHDRLNKFCHDKNNHLCESIILNLGTNTHAFDKDTSKSQ